MNKRMVGPLKMQAVTDGSTFPEYGKYCSGPLLLASPAFTASFLSSDKRAIFKKIFITKLVCPRDFMQCLTKIFFLVKIA